MIPAVTPAKIPTGQRIASKSFFLKDAKTASSGENLLKQLVDGLAVLCAQILGVAL